MTSSPNIAALGNWMHSWVQPNGAIHGFHNHPVWGTNPYRIGDFTAGHTTWSSPFIAGLAEAITKQPDARAKALVERMVEFQTTSFLPDGQYDHIGFNVGEICKKGLIHNAVPNLSLGLTALSARDWLASPLLDQIRSAILRNMNEGCLPYGKNGRPNETGVCNQEYARIWGKLLFMQAFDDKRWHDSTREDIEFMIRHFHINGIPDDDSTGTLRIQGIKDILEPSEYYGLMICPLILAAEIYGEERFLDEAGRLCRHVARSHWIDERGQTRCHRMWYFADNQWHLNRGPMLIAGMGDSLEGIQRYTRLRPDAELDTFLSACDQTYAHYQHPRGFLVSGSGWQSEIDIAPSTGWQSHDFRHLVHRHGVYSNFWAQFFAADHRVSLLLGDQCLWIEHDQHWTIADYLWQSVYGLIGRKDQVRFGPDLPDWIEGGWHAPADYRMPERPVFIKTDDKIALWSGTWDNLSVTSIAQHPLTVGPPMSGKSVSP
jgi:hypothetical protein|uniref:hypothetical protein n=1 Tax=Cephaloticoccus sp. TaxID=1985742 RepID=UPI00404AE5D8